MKNTSMDKNFNFKKKYEEPVTSVMDVESPLLTVSETGPGATDVGMPLFVDTKTLSVWDEGEKDY